MQIQYAIAKCKKTEKKKKEKYRKMQKKLPQYMIIKTRKKKKCAFRIATINYTVIPTMGDN